MQKGISDSRHGSSIVKCMPPPLPHESDDHFYSSFYSSIVSPNPSPFCIPQTDDITDDDSVTTTSFDYPQPLDLASYSPESRLFIDRRQDLIERQNLILSHLFETNKHAEALRQENINLRAANFNLNNRLAILLQSSALQNCAKPPYDCTESFPSSSANSLVDDFGRMRVGAKSDSEIHAWNEIPDDHQSPTSVIDEPDRVKNNDVDWVSMPKSISVRSNGYLTIQAGRHEGGRVPAPKRVKNVNETPRVYVHGGKKEEEQPLELEVYRQGMFKTELCNKWQQTGTCSYGDHCQFAHGIEELRPVLRHPRYKTEVCRMVLNGDPCPYGHRCHFRHTLTDEERFMGSSKRPSRALLKAYI